MCKNCILQLHLTHCLRTFDFFLVTSIYLRLTRPSTNEQRRLVNVCWYTPVRMSDNFQLVNAFNRDFIINLSVNMCVHISTGF